MNIAVILTGLGKALIYVTAGFLFIWFAKRIDDWRTKKFDDDVHIDNGNLAVGLRRGGLYLGIAVGISGAMSGTSSGFWVDIIVLLVDGLIVTGLMFSTRFINDLIMLGHVDNDEECIKKFKHPDGRETIGNSAVGLVEAAMYLATGFIIRGALYGDGGSFVQEIFSTIVFFVIGQFTLLLLGLVYELVTPFNVRQQIKENNPAAGIGLGGSIIALGIILMASISGPFTGWRSDIIGFGLYAVFGIMMLMIFRLVIDKLLLPTTNIAVEVEEDRNVAALVVVQSAVIALAVLIAFAM